MGVVSYARAVLLKCLLRRPRSFPALRPARRGAAASSHSVVVLSTTAHAPATQQEQQKTAPAAKQPMPRVRYPRVMPDAQEIQLQLANSQ